MDILKTPHEMLLEEAGAIPATPGMVNTPQQMLMQESGIMPHYALGGIFPHYVDGGSVSDSLPNVSFDLRSMPSIQGVKMMPDQMDIGANIPVDPGNLNISANRSINPIPGRGHMQRADARYSGVSDSLPNVSFDFRSMPSISGMPGVGYRQTPQGAMARMQIEKELGNNARVHAGVSGMGMSIPGQHGVKMMPDRMDIGAKVPLGKGNLDISANRSINPIPGRGHMQGINAKYSMPFAEGGTVGMTPEDMIAELVQQGHLPQHFASGGSTLKNIGIQAGFNVPFMAEDAELIAKDLKNQKYPEAAARTAGVGYSAFTPWNPLTALISGMIYSPEVGDATLDAYLAQKEAEAAPKPQPKPKRPAEKHNIIPFTETSFYKK